MKHIKDYTLFKESIDSESISERGSIASEVWVPQGFNKEMSKYPNDKITRKLVLKLADKWDIPHKDALEYVADAWVLDLDESLYTEAVDFTDRPSKISKEIFDIAKKGLPKDIISNIKSIHPNNISLLASPSSGSKKGVGTGEVEYKTIILDFKEPMGKANVTSLEIGIRKGTSGPGSGYVVITGSKDGNHYLIDNNPRSFAAYYIYDGAPEKLSNLFNTHIKKYFK